MKECLICQESSNYFLSQSCGHNDVCGECYTRNRIFYDRNRCLICTKEVEFRIMENINPIPQELKEVEKLVENMSLEDRKNKLLLSKKLDCYFSSSKDMHLFESKLKLSCSICRKIFSSIKLLKEHAKEKHSKSYCSTCLSKRKVFCYEQRLYSTDELALHWKNGDPAVNNEGALPVHIKCNLCNHYCYDREDYCRHMQLSHQCCQLCKRRGREVWLRDVNKLIEHFRNDHLVCDNPECLSNPLENVFENEIDLQGHIFRCHSANISKAERRALSRIQISFGSSESMPSLERTGESERLNSSNSLPVFPVDDRSAMEIMQTFQSSADFDCFRSISMQYFAGEVSGKEYLVAFCVFFRLYEPLGSLWMKLVSSLQSFELREGLNKAHYDAVKNNWSFSKCQLEGLYPFAGDVEAENFRQKFDELRASWTSGNAKLKSKDTIWSESSATSNATSSTNSTVSSSKGSKKKFGKGNSITILRCGVR